MEAVAALLGAGALVLVVGALVALYVSRQRTLTQRVGSFACQLRAGSAAWTAGIAQYGTGRLVWWRTLSFAPRPARTWSRATLEVLDRTPLGEEDELGRPLVVVRCRHDDEGFELIMSSGAYAGLVSWLEAGPRPVGRAL